MALDPDLESTDGVRLELLAKLVEDYEKSRFAFAKPDPIDAIVFRMEQRGLRQKDIASLLGGKNRASEVLARKRPLTLPMIRALHEKLDLPPVLLIREPRAQYAVSPGLAGYEGFVNLGDLIVGHLSGSGDAGHLCRHPSRSIAPEVQGPKPGRMVQGARSVAPGRIASGQMGCRRGNHLCRQGRAFCDSNIAQANPRTSLVRFRQGDWPQWWPCAVATRRDLEHPAGLEGDDGRPSRARTQDPGGVSAPIRSIAVRKFPRVKTATWRLVSAA